MLNTAKSIPYMLLLTGCILFFILLLQPLEVFHFREYIAVLFPKGWVASQQLNLLLILQALMLLVIIPVYVLTFIFSWKYSVYNPKSASTYDPDLVDHRVAEFIWWGIPLVMTLIIGVLSWVKTYELDPFKQIATSAKEKMTIQVVALQWKWLFIYPKEKIASVNFLQFPTGTPVHFQITADAPMNSFWIPDLGGQIYAMPSMTTQLHLIANEAGDFRGSSANLSGEGFAGMHFITRASSDEDYQQWVAKALTSPQSLNFEIYNQLAAPSQDNPVELYQLRDDNLFDQITMKYMHPQNQG